MKAFKYLLLISAVAGSMILESCSKDPVTNNNNTGSTAGKITCKVNGSAWASDGQDKFYYPNGDTLVGTIATLSNGELSIQGTRVLPGDTSTIGINLVLTPAKTGKYEGTFDINAADGALYLPNRNFLELLGIIMTYTNTYSVTLTKVDTANKKVSGVFTISMKSPDGTKNYMITEGAFTDLDLK